MAWKILDEAGLLTMAAPGEWLPVPGNRRNADLGAERDARFRRIGAWIVLLWVVSCVGTTGLIWQGGAKFGQVVFGAMLYCALSGLLLLGLCSLIWYLD